MTIDLSKAKVGDKVKHRNGGITNVSAVKSSYVGCTGLVFYIANGHLEGYSHMETPFDIVELIPAENELDLAADNLATTIKCGWEHESIKADLLNFAKAIKESR